MAMAASLAQAVAVGGFAVALHDVEHGRSAEATLACSCSFRSPSGAQRGQRALLPRGSWGARVRRELVGFQPPARPRKRLQRSVCLTRGVNGASREGADSESSANQLTTKVDPLRKEDISVLLSLIQEVEPLDISLISKDVSSDSTDAMKRTISGMLGLLPSNQFQVTIEAPEEPLGRLLVSSMMTGYTLRNGEYRLCLKRSLDLEHTEEDLHDWSTRATTEDRIMEIVGAMGLELLDPVSEDEVLSPTPDNDLEIVRNPEGVVLPEELGEVSAEVASYIQSLQSKLSATSKELDECKHALSTLEMESLAGEEHNDLLDYLRSLEPEKVAELSQPTSPEVEHVINGVIDGLLANLCLDQASKVPSFGDEMSGISNPWEEKKASDVVGDEPLQFQSKLTVSRDYLARLLFWCMLLGHYMRAVEYRLELTRTLNLSGEVNLGRTRSRHS